MKSFLVVILSVYLLAFNSINGSRISLKVKKTIKSTSEPWNILAQRFDEETFKPAGLPVKVGNISSSIEFWNCIGINTFSHLRFVDISIYRPGFEPNFLALKNYPNCHFFNYQIDHPQAADPFIDLVLKEKNNSLISKIFGFSLQRINGITSLKVFIQGIVPNELGSINDRLDTIVNKVKNLKFDFSNPQIGKLDKYYQCIFNMLSLNNPSLSFQVLSEKNELITEEINYESPPPGFDSIIIPSNSSSSLSSLSTSSLNVESPKSKKGSNRKSESRPGPNTSSPQSRNLSSPQSRNLSSSQSRNLSSSQSRNLSSSQSRNSSSPPSHPEPIISSPQSHPEPITSSPQSYHELLSSISPINTPISFVPKEITQDNQNVPRTPQASSFVPTGTINDSESPSIFDEAKESNLSIAARPFYPAYLR